ncbi:MAG TPA: TIGR02530 family flagellar biosynthesis protein [Solirubrobacterales bacterium]|nr:TIGR02530 family flagellar biosynthesis protein [Solirubrobacterales bacterium]
MSPGPTGNVGGLPALPPAATQPPAQRGPSGAGGVTAPSFAEQLRQKQASAGSGGVEFSKHAIERMQRRGIPTDPTTIARLGNGVDLAAGKNARDAVVMVDDNAFVVSVANRTVITAIDRAHMRQHVFTNIDSAVVA